MIDFRFPSFSAFASDPNATRSGFSEELYEPGLLAKYENERYLVHESVLFTLLRRHEESLRELRQKAIRDRKFSSSNLSSSSYSPPDSQPILTKAGAFANSPKPDPSLNKGLRQDPVMKQELVNWKKIQRRHQKDQVHLILSEKLIICRIPLESNMSERWERYTNNYGPR